MKIKVNKDKRTFSIKFEKTRDNLRYVTFIKSVFKCRDKFSILPSFSINGRTLVLELFNYRLDAFLTRISPASNEFIQDIINSYPFDKNDLRTFECRGVSYIIYTKNNIRYTTKVSEWESKKWDEIIEADFNVLFCEEDELKYITPSGDLENIPIG